MLLKLFTFTKKDFAAPLKENKKFLVKKIRRFRIRENMSRVSYSLFVQSALADTFFLGDRRRGGFSCFSMVLANFQDKHAEIRSMGAKIIATYPKKVQGSLTTQIRKVFNIPSHVLTSTFNFSIGSCLIVSCSDAILNEEKEKMLLETQCRIFLSFFLYKINETGLIFSLFF